MSAHHDNEAKAEDEDHQTPRPRWIGWALVIFMLLVAFGVLNVGWLIMRPAPSKEVVETLLQSRPELAVGKKLVESSDCMRCHGIEGSPVGPSFVDIATRYRDRVDATDYVARKIREGGGGEWGRNLMPRHPQINQEQAEQMAHYLLALQPLGAQTAP